MVFGYSFVILYPWVSIQGYNDVIANGIYFTFFGFLLPWVETQGYKDAIPNGIVLFIKFRDKLIQQY